jgi:RNA polymerase sigma-70 factor (ECF subfamily)
MSEYPTTAAIQRHLDALAAADTASPAEPAVRALLARSVDRLHQQCAGMLRRRYPRLTGGPVNLRSEELLSAVAERLIKAMRRARPTTVRQFFSLANQHMRWELNEVARRLDEEAMAVELRDSPVWDPRSEDESARANSGLSHILEAIEALPADEREAFTLVRVQGLTQAEAAGVAGCSLRTLQRRLSRSLVLLTDRLGDLGLRPRPVDEPCC